MAGIVTHLAIADKILEKLPKGEIKSTALFYCGNIAPDGVHAREGYVRAHKKNTHMRDEIPDMDFLQAENLAIFQQRTCKFIAKYYNPYNEFADLYKGYISHILTDELFMKTIRQDFVEKMSEDGIHQDDKAFYNRIIFDLNNNDIRLAKEYPFKRNPDSELESVWDYSITDYLTAQELNDSKRWVVNYYFREKNPFNHPIYFTYEKVLRFIDTAADDIIIRLSAGIEFPKIFNESGKGSLTRSN